jgi:cysteine synthase
MSRAQTAARAEVCESIADAVEGTPMVRLTGVTDGLRCAPLAKCAFLDPWRTHDATAALRLLRCAEADGRLRPGDTVIEASSGELGVGLAAVAVSSGYRVIVTMPHGAGADVQGVLAQLGVRVVRTPPHAAPESIEGYVGAARWLARTLPRAHLLSDWTDLAGPRVYALHMAQEILDQCGGNLHTIVIANGSAVFGAIVGTLREMVAALETVVVDFCQRGQGERRLVGVGAPRYRHESQHGRVHRWLECSRDDADAMAQRLAREERMLAGPLSGAVVHAALRVAGELGAGDNVVAVLPDSISAD